MPSVVPNVLGDGELAFGRAGWADAATIVPWAVHVAYGDREVLARQLPSMKAHVGYLQATAPRRRPARRRVPVRRLARPGRAGRTGRTRPRPRPTTWPTRSSRYSARLVARAAAVLGDAESPRGTRTSRTRSPRLTWARWREHAPTTQTGCAVAVELGIAPARGARARSAQALARLVRDADGRIATGFLGTPLVLPALTRTGHLAEAYLMLLRRELPSWLYQVTAGATTVWERWDAIRADGSIHDGRHGACPTHESEMLSFNHYAYGAVVDWVYRHARRHRARTRRRRATSTSILAPQPVDGIDRVTASVETAFGTVAVEWSTDGDGRFIGAVHDPVRGDGDLRAARPPRTRW